MMLSSTLRYLRQREAGIRHPNGEDGVRNGVAPTRRRGREDEIGGGDGLVGDDVAGGSDRADDVDVEETRCGRVGTFRL